ncbi:MAG: site-specific integrase [Clostridia bacterium]|nr:site-specific integrase [Clostridia bacterium]
MKENQRLKEIINEWLQIKKITLKESTYYGYVYQINQYIIPYFKDISMQELEKYDINKFVEELMKTLKPSTLKNVMILFKAILVYSMKKYKYNFNFDFLAMPKIHKEELKVLSARKKSRLEKYCLKSNTLRDIGIIICLNTGLRIGEICALKWECIDLEKRCIKVKQTMQRVYNKVDKKSSIVIDLPKSDNSIRTIPLSSKLYNILKPLKNQYSKNSYFLSGSPCKYIEPRNYQKMFKNCMKVCNIKGCHFHTLRHSFSSDCIAVGMDAKSLSEILGHSDVKITMNRYVHSNINIKKKYLEKL